MKKYALLVIDVQKNYTLPSSRLYIDDCEPVIANINKLIKTFQEKHLPVIYVKHSYRADGADAGRMWDFSGSRKPSAFIEDTEPTEYADSLKIVPENIEIVKHRYSSFKGTELQSYLIQHHVDSVVITGFMTNFCCETTAREAHDLDYYAYFISDGTSCPKTVNGVDRKLIKEVVHATMGAGFAVIHTTETMIHLLKDRPQA